MTQKHLLSLANQTKAVYKKQYLHQYDLTNTLPLVIFACTGVLIPAHAYPGQKKLSKLVLEALVTLQNKL